MGYMTGNSSLSCSCGRTFSQHNALSNHQRTCPTTSRRVSGALTKFKALFEGKKRRRLQDEGILPENEAHYADQRTPGQTEVPPCISLLPEHSGIEDAQQEEEIHVDNDAPIAERRERREIVPPKRYVDVLPEPPPNLPPPSPIAANSRIFCFFQSPRNIFGLRRRYYSTDLPSHDPEAAYAARILYH